MTQPFVPISRSVVDSPDQSDHSGLKRERGYKTRLILRLIMNIPEPVLFILEEDSMEVAQEPRRRRRHSCRKTRSSTNNSQLSDVSFREFSSEDSDAPSRVARFEARPFLCLRTKCNLSHQCAGFRRTGDGVCQQ